MIHNTDIKINGCTSLWIKVSVKCRKYKYKCKAVKYGGTIDVNDEVIFSLLLLVTVLWNSNPDQ